MSTATAPETAKSANGSAPTEAPRPKQLPAIAAERLPYHPAIEERFGIDRASWRALVEAIFPNASSIDSVIMALSYCRARRLDVFKRVVHIVPIWNKELGRMMDTVWPGIGELRTTAFRTGEYAGRARAVFGPTINQKVGNVEMAFPEWCQVTLYRMVKGQRVEFSGPEVYWLETYAQQKRNDESPNEMWRSRPRGQLEKCAEATALRAAFPEEVGGDYIPEEVEHRSTIDVTPTADPAKSLDSLADRLLAEPQAAVDMAPAMRDPTGAHADLSPEHRQQASQAVASEASSDTEADPLASDEDLLNDCERELAACNGLSAVTDAGFAWTERHPKLRAQIDQLVIVRKGELRPKGAK